MNHLETVYDQRLDDAFEKTLDQILGAHDGVELANFQRVGPKARHQLKGLLKHYAKMEHPFTQCVRDNRKRFGPRAESVCAVLKDIIWGTTKWRGKGNPKGRGPHPVMASEAPVIDDETAALIDRLSELDLWELMGAVSNEN